MGLSEEQIAALRDNRYIDSPLFDERQRTVARFAERVSISPRQISDADVDALRWWFSEDQIVESLVLVSAMNMTNRFNIVAGTNVDGVFLAPTLVSRSNREE